MTFFFITYSRYRPRGPYWKSPLSRQCRPGQIHSGWSSRASSSSALRGGRTGFGARSMASCQWACRRRRLRPIRPTSGQACWRAERGRAVATPSSASNVGRKRAPRVWPKVAAPKRTRRMDGSCARWTRSSFRYSGTGQSWRRRSSSPCSARSRRRGSPVS